MFNLTPPTLVLVMFFVGMVVVVVTTVPLTRLAYRVGLVDQPNERKRHDGSVPLVGGTALMLGLVISVALTGVDNPTVLSIVVLGPAAWAMGLLDDRYELSAKGRLVAQIGLGVVLSVAMSISIASLDGILGVRPILLSGTAGIAFTAFCLCGVLNACNMSDGVDGLLGSLATLTLFTVAYLAWSAGEEAEALLALAIAGGLCGYLLFNLGLFGPSRRVFLGDSGSMLVGLVLAVLLIALSQGKRPTLSPTSACWLFGLPLLDTVSVMIRRAAEGRSLFAAGRDHLHHVLLDSGLRPRQVLLTMCVLQLIMVSIGLTANMVDVPQGAFFWLFAAIILGEFFAVRFVLEKIDRNKFVADGEVFTAKQAF